MSNDPPSKSRRVITVCLLGIAAIVVGLIVWLFVLPYNPGAAEPNFTISKATTHITSPLDARGRPDYVAWLNAKYGEGATNENNAFVTFLVTVPDDEVSPGERERFYDVLGIDTHDKSARLSHQSDEVGAQTGNTVDTPWSDDAFAELSAYLDANEAALDAIVHAVNRPRWHIPIVMDDDDLLMIHQSTIAGQVLGPAQLLYARMLRSSARGEIDVMVRDFDALMRIGAHLSHGTSAPEYGMALLVRGIALHACERVVRTAEFDTAGWRKLVAALDAAPPMREFWRNIDDADRAGMLHMIVLMSDNPDAMSEDGFGPNKIFHRWADWDGAMATINQRTDALVAALKTADLPTRHRKLALLEAGGSQGRSGVDRAAHVLMDITLSSLVSIQHRMDRIETRQRLLRVAIRLAEHRETNVGYPQSLEGLDAYRDTDAPNDPYSNRPLIYRQTDHGYLLYSVGEDFDDDDGTPPATDPPDVITVGATKDGDIVIRVGGEP